MKKYLVLLFSLISVFGYTQTLHTNTNTTALSVNNANTLPTTVSGTNTYTATLPSAGTITDATNFFTDITDRLIYYKFTNAATSGPFTLNLNSEGAKTLKKRDATGSIVDIVATDIAAGQVLPIRYNGTYLVIEGGAGGGGVSDWGDIGGTLSDQTDLQAALDAKQDDITTLPVANGGTGVTASTGASSVVLRDANQNITANNTLTGYATTATAAGTTTLTVSSARDQYFTGSTTQTVVLPVVSTLTLGHTFLIVNNSSGIVTVQTSGSNVIQAMAPNSTLREECILTSGTGTASWSSLYTVSNPMTTWGDIVYGGDPGAGGVAPLSKLGPGTAGYVLSTNGSGAAPSWISPGGLSGLTATRIPVATSGTTIGDYSGLKWDDSGRTFTLGYSSAGSNVLNFHQSAGIISVIANVSTGEARLMAGSTYFWSIYSNNAEAMRVHGSTRNVLIGTTTDNSKLTVNGSVAFAYVAKTANYTATISDYTIECTANTFQVTLPTAVGIAGREYVIVNSGAGTITIGTTSSQTFVNVTATPTTLTMATIGTRVVISNGANWMLKNSL